MNTDEGHQQELEEQEEIALDPEIRGQFERFMEKQRKESLRTNQLVTKLEQDWSRTQTRFKKELSNAKSQRYDPEQILEKRGCG